MDVVQTSDQAVDPPEAERLAREVFVGHRLDAGVLLVADEPYAGAGRVVLREPPPPFPARSHGQREQVLRHVDHFFFRQVTELLR